MKHNFHAIIGPNGMCECGVRDDGTVVTCGGLLEQEIVALHGSEAGPQEAREGRPPSKYHWGETMTQYATLGIGAEAWVELENVEERAKRGAFAPTSGITLNWRTFRLVMTVLRAIRIEDFRAGSEAGVSARVLELARSAAASNHYGRRRFGSDDHPVERWDECPHPDCVLVRASPASAPPDRQCKHGHEHATPEGARACLGLEPLEGRIGDGEAASGQEKARCLRQRASDTTPGAKDAQHQCLKKS